MLRVPTTLFIFAAFVLGCQSSSSQSVPASKNVQQTRRATVLAYVAGKPVTMHDLQPTLIEAAGREVLRQYVLDQAITRKLTRAELTINDEDIQTEKNLLLSTLSDDPGTAVRLFRELRKRRGLGDRRFRALLRRNASLRKLIADDVQVSDAAVTAAYEQAYGLRYRARVIVISTLNLASQIRAKLAGGKSFGDLAVTHSTDTSAAAGGRLSPISPVDAAYPKVIRDTLTRLEVGQVSEPVSVEGGFAILKLEATIPPPEVLPLETKHLREKLRGQVRLVAERLLMDQLARELLDSARVVILDADLHRVWDPGEPGEPGGPGGSSR